MSEDKVGTARERTDQISEGVRRAFHKDVEYAGGLTGATPSVMDVNAFKCGTAVVTITNFRHGQEGQTIKILGHANTTISNNATIKTNTGANKVLAALKIYTFTMFSNVWYEDE